jgi:hypothetical protein
MHRFLGEGEQIKGHSKLTRVFVYWSKSYLGQPLSISHPCRSRDWRFEYEGEPETKRGVAHGLPWTWAGLATRDVDFFNSIIGITLILLQYKHTIVITVLKLPMCWWNHKLWRNWLMPWFSALFTLCIWGICCRLWSVKESWVFPSRHRTLELLHPRLI